MFAVDVVHDRTHMGFCGVVSEVKIGDQGDPESRK